jgi:glycerol 2-dehydrogenase (NADP+)
VADVTVAKLADKAAATAGQILLSWGVQRGTSVIPKSENEDRLRSNFTVWPIYLTAPRLISDCMDQLVRLSDEDMKTLDELHRQPGLHRSVLAYHTDGKVFGWTHEELGWNFDDNGIVLQ